MIEGQTEPTPAAVSTQSLEEKQQEALIANILEHVPGWSEAVQASDQLEIRRLNGMSNACYKVALKSDVQLPPNCQSPRQLLYRKFECQIVNRQIESRLFESMSEMGLGAKLIYECASFRIESFFEGRPLTIWELRNPVVMEEAVKAIFGFHNNHRANDAIEEVMPMQPHKLGVDTAIDEWAPQVLTRIGKIRSRLVDSENGQQAIILQALQMIETTFFKPGYQEFLRALVPRQKIVLSHNDCQENNILCSLEDATRFMLIDYEYGMWNPQAYDLGCYLNEMVCDNAHPLGNGIAHYMRNFPTDAEIESMTRQYASLQAERENAGVCEWSMERQECQEAVQNTKKCMILNNFYWGVWSIMMLSETDETNPNIFNWELGIGRCQIYLKCVEQFGIGQI